MRTVTRKRSTAGRILRTVRQSVAFLYRYVRVLRYRPVGLLWMLGFPAAFYLITIATFIDFSTIPASYHGAVRATTALSYGIFGAVLVSLTTVSGGLVSDLEADRTGVYRSIGVSPAADLAGRVGSALCIAAVSVLVVIGVSLLTGATYTISVTAVPIVVVAFIGSVLPWIVIAYVVAISTKSKRYATLIAVSLALVSYFATGFNGTVPATFTADPAWLNVLPNTLSTRILIANTVAISDAAGAGLAPPALPTDWTAVGILVGYASVAVGILHAIGIKRLYNGRIGE
ncbi:ABC transporter permease [Halorubraceae archaeon YAN]|nr:ABC transporter permease [Halorubraceae archaeon YAN]